MQASKNSDGIQSKPDDDYQKKLEEGLQARIDKLQHDHDLTIVEIRQAELELRNEAIRNERNESERALQELRDAHKAELESKVDASKLDECTRCTDIREKLIKHRAEQLEAMDKHGKLIDQQEIELSNLRTTIKDMDNLRCDLVGSQEKVLKLEKANDVLEDRILELKEEVDDLREKYGQAEEKLQARQDIHTKLIADLKTEHQATITTHTMKTLYLEEALTAEKEKHSLTQASHTNVEEEVQLLKTQVNDLNARIRESENSLRDQQAESKKAQLDAQGDLDTVVDQLVTTRADKDRLQSTLNHEVASLREQLQQSVGDLEAERVKLTTAEALQATLNREVASLRAQLQQSVADLEAERAKLTTAEASSITSLKDTHARVIAKLEKSHQRTLEKLDEAVKDKELMKESHAASESARSALLRQIESEKQLLQEKFNDLSRESQEETKRLEAKIAALKASEEMGAKELKSIDASYNNKLSDAATKLTEAQNQLRNERKNADVERGKLTAAHELVYARLEEENKGLKDKVDDMKKKQEQLSREHQDDKVRND